MFEAAKAAKGGLKMFNMMFHKPKDPSNASSRKKEIVVRIVNSSTDTQPKRTFIDETELCKEYEEEVKVFKHANLAQGLAVGGAIGLLICALASVNGTLLTSGEMAAIVSIPAMLGIIAGFVFS